MIVIFKVLKENTRAYDIIGRFGGDEFMICLPITNHKGALNIGNRIISYFNKEKLEISDNEIKIIMSIGIFFK